MIAAVFDVDRTLLPDTTAERLFLRYLIRERVLGARAALETMRFVAVRGWPHPIRAVRANRPYLGGQRVAGMTELGARCYDEVIRPRLAGAGIERVRDHAARGHRTVLLSGSLPFVLKPMADALGVDDVICSQLADRNQRLTGRLLGPHPYGSAKALLVRRLAEERQIDLGQSFCYADHHTDVGMLRLFGHPVCINPNDRLRSVAQRLGWPIEEFR
ncbi:MAG TPA: HAD-IB family hydrolase [Thermomicrobiaceae bacterium]|nr:HAD-IB family hydrolase [Thermomicrobiaceae bacterium]